MDKSSTVRKPYHSPQLAVYGNLREITLGTKRTSSDGGGGGTHLRS